MLEIAGAIGLLIPQTRKLAGICLALYLVAVFPANIFAALNEVTLRGAAATPLWVRAPMQLLYIVLVWWTSIKEPVYTQREAGGEPATTQRGEQQPSS